MDKRRELSENKTTQKDKRRELLRVRQNKRIRGGNPLGNVKSLAMIPNTPVKVWPNLRITHIETLKTKKGRNVGNCTQLKLTFKEIHLHVPFIQNIEPINMKL